MSARYKCCFASACMLPWLALVLVGCGRENGVLAQPGKIETRTNSIGMVLVHIPAGSFLMGHAPMERPFHRVQVSDFWMGQYEVTNAQYDQFRKRPRPAVSPSDQQPAVNISWHDAAAFCQWLSRKEGRHYRLPTEAEWEYAARGGPEQRDYPWGDAPPDGRAAVAMLKTMPVGSYAPNGFGLYDMAGNIEEWVSDWFDEEYYGRSPSKDPTGPAEPPKIPDKVMRGGGFNDWEPYVWLRAARDPGWVAEFQGFRVAFSTIRRTSSAKATEQVGP